MILPLAQYSTLVFDCDGVLLNSNSTKTEGFQSISRFWGEQASNELVNYHLMNGGISRYQKLSYFINHILPRYFASTDLPLIEDLLHDYGQYVRQGLSSATIAPDLDLLRSHTSTSKWCVVSGSDQLELRQIFSERKLDKYFDGGIFGSPDDKSTILSREILSGNIQLPALFVGDSRYDYTSSKSAGLDFVFVSIWSDLIDWHSFVDEQRIFSVDKLSDLLHLP